MVNIKNKLIKLGTTNPELRIHIRPVLKHLAVSKPPIELSELGPMSVRDLDKLLDDHDYHTVYRGVDTHNMHKKIIREMENDFPRDISVLGMSYKFTLYNPAEDLFIIGAWVTQHDHYLRSQGEPARESLDWAVYNPKTRRIEDSNSFWEEEMGGYNNAMKFILDYKDGYAAIDEN